MQNILKIRNLIPMFIGSILIVSVLIINSPGVVNAYSYSGKKWPSYPVSVDVSDPSVPFSWISSIAGAMSAWNAVSSPFYFNSGATGHQIKLASVGTGNPLAYTDLVWNGSNQLTDADMTFNTSYSWSTSPTLGTYDVRNTATHEFGHWLKLNDLTTSVDTEKTMYYGILMHETKKRSLETDDLNGINAVYP